MKFMITWRLYSGKLPEALTVFSNMTPEQIRGEFGPGVKLTGRWHDLARGRGVAVCETDSAEALAGWLLKWNHMMDLDVAVVTDDQETRAIWKRQAQES